MNPEIIDQWIADPDSCQVEKDDLLPTLALVEKRLVDAWEHGRDVEHRALRAIKQKLLVFLDALQQEAEAELEKQPMRETEAGVKIFATLSQAVACLAELIEQDSPAGLLATSAHIWRTAPAEPAYSQHFSQRIFPQLQAYQREIDFRVRYQGRRFPVEGTRFKLGGHMAELGCLHIDFAKLEDGWVLDEIWECR